MPFLEHIITAGIVACICTAIFAFGFSRARLLPILLVFFLIDFLWTWEGGIWMIRFDVPLFDDSISHFIIAGIVSALD
ncbi:MAG: hypothetical protein ACOYVJ_06530 [Nitrospirota bacterium]